MSIESKPPNISVDDIMAGRNPMSPHLKELLALLNSHEVRYLVTGGYALAAHGSPRYTKDLDLWIDPTKANLEKLEAALREFGFEEAAERSQRLGAEGPRLLQLGNEPTRVDLLNFASGVSFAQCYEAHISSRIDEVSVPIIGREDLIRNKLASGRLSDLGDLERLGVEIDQQTIERVIHKKDK